MCGYLVHTRNMSKAWQRKPTVILPALKMIMVRKRKRKRRKRKRKSNQSPRKSGKVPHPIAVKPRIQKWARVEKKLKWYTKAS